MEDNSKKKPAEIPVDDASSATREELGKMSLEELNTLLNEVLEQEDYIRAIAIRDEINKRK